MHRTGHCFLPKLWARHQDDIFFLLGSISLLSSSTLYCLAAVLKLLLHLLWLLQPLPQRGTGNSRELPHHGDSVPEEADVLSLSPKDGEALCKKHAFHPEIPSASLKKFKKSLFSAFWFCLDTLHLNTFLRKGSEI